LISQEARSVGETLEAAVACTASPNGAGYPRTAQRAQETLPNASVHKSRVDDPLMLQAPMKVPSRATGQLNPMTLVHFCKNFRARGKREPPPGHRTFTCPNSSRISRASKSSPNFVNLPRHSQDLAVNLILESIRQNGKRHNFARPMVQADDDMHEQDRNWPFAGRRWMMSWMAKSAATATDSGDFISAYCRRPRIS
jgi:hypothetical protein